MSSACWGGLVSCARTALFPGVRTLRSTTKACTGARASSRLGCDHEHPVALALHFVKRSMTDQTWGCDQRGDCCVDLSTHACAARIVQSTIHTFHNPRVGLETHPRDLGYKVPPVAACGVLLYVAVCGDTCGYPEYSNPHTRVPVS